MYGNYYSMGYRPNYYPMNPNLPDNFSQPVTPVPGGSPQTGNGLVWVQGEAGAKSYIVAPGSTVMLMDSENSVFYIKSADVSGMPMPLRIFEYTERTGSVPQPTGQGTDFSRFVTREELEQRLAAMSQVVTKDDKAKEGFNNA